MAYISFESLQNSLFNVFCIEKDFINLSYYTEAFLVGSIFKNIIIVWNILGSTY